MAINLDVQEQPNIELEVIGSDRADFSIRDMVEVVASNDYDDLINRPQINGVTLTGNKTAEDLGIEAGVSSFNGQTGDVTFAETDPTVPSWAKAQNKPTYTAQEVGALPSNTPIPSNTSDLNNDSGFITASDIPVTSVNGKTGAVSLSASDVSALPSNTAYVGSASVTQSLSSGTKVGTITIDGTATDLYAPTDTDTKVTQTLTTISGYTYWRGVLIGNASASTESGDWGTTTEQARTFNNLRYQPSTGTLKTTTFKGALEGTASGNLKSGDNISTLTNDAGYITLADLPIYDGGVS